MADDKRLERIEAKLDDTNEHLSSIDVTLAKQHVSLAEHMRRTSLIEEELKPIKKHVDMVQGIIKFLLSVGALTGILELFKALK